MRFSAPMKECGLPGCHALVPPRSSRYCCRDHGEAARQKKNRDKAMLDTDDQYRIHLASGHGKRSPHYVFVHTGYGVILDGGMTKTLRTLVTELETAVADHQYNLTTRSPQNALMFREVEQAINDLTGLLGKTIGRKP